jgi:hypothetical protein
MRVTDRDGGMNAVQLSYGDALWRPPMETSLFNTKCSRRGVHVLKERKSTLVHHYSAILGDAFRNAGNRGLEAKFLETESRSHTTARRARWLGRDPLRRGGTVQL